MAVSTIAENSDLTVQRSVIYGLLARGWTFPSEDLYESLRSGDFRRQLLDALSAISEISSSLNLLPADRKYSLDLAAAVGNIASPESLAELKAEHTGLFAHMGFAQCPPYETDYGPENTFMKTNEMADVAGFYRAFGVELSPQAKERPDYIGIELEFMHYLAFKQYYALQNNESEHAQICFDAEQKFLLSHLGRWVKAFGRAVRQGEGETFYPVLSRFTEAFVSLDCRLLGVQPAELISPKRNEQPDSPQCCSPSNEAP